MAANVGSIGATGNRGRYPTIMASQPFGNDQPIWPAICD
jgi:hypothetical protein